ncbi:hypothetical protein ABVT39_022055 [Epinephelus coioides]
MIKYENERNQRSWNGSSHTIGPQQVLRLNPADPSQTPRRQRRDDASALLRNLDGK